MERPDNFIGRTDVVTVRMRADIKFKIILCHAHRTHIGNHLVFVSLPLDNTGAGRVTGIASCGIIVILTGIHHTELAVALQKNSFRVRRKRKKMNRSGGRSGLD